MPTPDAHDGDRLRVLMDRSAVSVATLARALDVSDQGVQKWLRTGQIARTSIPGICRAIRCSADELLGLVPIASAARVAESQAVYFSLSEAAQQIIQLAGQMRHNELDTLVHVSRALARLSISERQRDLSQ